MAKVKIQGNASGTGILTVTAPNTSTDRTITLPDATGTLLNSDGSGANLTNLPNGSQLDHSGTKKIEATATGVSVTGASYSTSNIGLNVNNFLGFSDNSFGRLVVNDTEICRVLSTGGITFNGDTAAANALDDYEEGTWTPTISGTSTCSMSTIHNSHYTKVGSVVQLYTSFNVTSSAVPATGALVFGGFPFAFKTLGESAFLITVYYNYRETPMCFMNKNGNTYYQNTTVGGNNLGDLTAALDAEQTFGMTFSYLTDA